VAWDEQEDETWSILYDRQTKAVSGVASQIFTNGLAALNLSSHKVPQLPDINKVLDSFHGWGVEAVPALIQPQEFYELLSQKRFPAATFIRVPSELDYIQEPDIFHEIYGHTPLLVDPVITEFMHRFGQLALSAQKKYRRKLFRLFWFTIEFGMIMERGKTRPLGAGILSSIGETGYCMSDQCEYQKFNALDVMRTPYRIDIMQPLYFVLDRVEDLLDVLELDLLKLIDEAAELGDFPAKFEMKGKTLDTDSGVMGS
jgi:phenylalanine-4-hydroxylase